MTMMNNGIAGMSAAYTSLLVTSNNIANASVAGYSRQQAVYNTSPTGGVYVDRIERIADSFYISQLQDASSSLGYSTSYASQANKLESVLGSDSMSLSPSLNAFFGALTSAQSDPMDIAHRQQVLSEADNLASQFNTLSSQINKQLNDINNELETMVSEVNSLLEQVAKLNTEISRASASGQVSGQLLDERDKLVQQVSELVGVEVVVQHDQSVDLFLPSGEPLVVKGNASSLALVDGYPDASMKDIALDTGSHVKTLNETGGAIQAQIDFRDEELLPSLQELDRLALILADSINSQLEEGYDLNGDSGKPLFNDINSPEAQRSRSSSLNGSSATLAVEISNSSSLTAENYVIEIRNGEPVVMVMPGGEEIESKMVNGELVFDGLTVSLEGGELKEGDSFYIQPGKGAAAGIDMIMENAEYLAFSSDPDEPGNNENLLKLSEIQDEKLVEGNLSINDAYKSMVLSAGATAGQAMKEYDASLLIYQDANSRVLSVAGVNMDEEASNLIAFQQYYNANARVIQSADQLFNTVLGL